MVVGQSVQSSRKYGRISRVISTLWEHITIKRPISQIPQCIRQMSHNAPFCNRNVQGTFLLQNGALWDMGLVDCGIVRQVYWYLLSWIMKIRWLCKLIFAKVDIYEVSSAFGPIWTDIDIINLDSAQNTQVLINLYLFVIDPSKVFNCPIFRILIFQNRS